MKITPAPTSGAADLPEALRSIQRFEVVDCIDDKHVPAVIPKPHGPWVRYEDHIAALAAGRATAAQAVVPPNAITAAIVRDDGGEAPAFCLMAAYRSEKDAMDALALITTAPARDLAAVIKGAADKLDAAVRCHPNAVDTLIHEALEILDGDREPDAASRGQAPAAPKGDIDE